MPARLIDLGFAHTNFFYFSQLRCSACRMPRQLRPVYQKRRPSCSMNCEASIRQSCRALCVSTMDEACRQLRHDSCGKREEF